MSPGPIALTNSTVANNRADDHGGGISTENNGQSAVSAVNLLNVTVAGNVANADRKGDGNGAGIYNETDGSVVSMHNTIVANNTTKNVGPDVANVITSLGYNLIGNTTGGSGFAPTDLLNLNPQLGSLQDNGGPTLTVALLAGTPALDAGDPDTTGLPATDQRGLPRIVYGRMDIGALEAENTASQFTLTTPSTVTVGVAFSLTITVVDAYGRVATGYTGTVHFSSSDGTATLPADYTFTAADQGVATFAGVVLQKKGKVTISLTDTLDSSLVGSVTEQVR